jgi:hypothetical protein
MPVYVGDIEYPFGRMLMSHMVADTDEELHAMAAKIGVARKWHQKSPPHSLSHYDICKSMKVKAIKFGAVEMSDRDIVKKFPPVIFPITPQTP